MRVSLGTLLAALTCAGPLWAQGAPMPPPAPSVSAPDAATPPEGDAPSPPSEATDPAPVAPATPPPVAPPPDPRASARAMYQAARDAYQQGRLEGALTLVEKAFEQFDAPTLLLARAYILDRLGRRPDARAAYTTYLRRRPDDPERRRIEQRVAELSGTVAPMGGPPGAFPRDLPPPPPPEPEKPKPPKTHDGLLFFRPSVFFGQLDGTAAFRGDVGSTQEEERAYSSTYYGVGVSIGLVPTPGFAIAFEGQLINSDFNYTETYTDYNSVEHSEDGDEAGPGATASLELHFFTSPQGGLHLNAGGGFMSMGDDDLDKLVGFGAHVGIGWAFWVSNTMAIDPMFRVDLMPDGDRGADIVYKAINLGLLWD